MEKLFKIKDKNLYPTNKLYYGDVNITKEEQYKIQSLN